MSSKKRAFIIVQIIFVIVLFIYSFYISIVIGKSISNGENWNNFYLANRKRINKITNTVDVTVPKEFMEILGDDFDYTLTNDQKKNGFTKISTNAAGDIVFTISKTDYKNFIDELKETTKQTLKEQIDDLNGSNTSIRTVKYTSDLDNIKIYVDEAEYAYTLDSVNITVFALTAYTYQIYNVDSDKIIKVEIINYQTDKVIEIYNYPDNV